MAEDNIDSDDITAGFRAFRDSFHSVQMATVNAQGVPEASVAPCIRDGKDIYVFVSELSRHTANLMQRPRLSLLFVEAEAGARQPFARRRLSYSAIAEQVARDDASFDRILDDFHRQFGSIVDVLRGLNDFHLLKLVPLSGSYVAGFGKAFELRGDALDELAPVSTAIGKDADGRDSGRSRSTPGRQ